MSRRRGIRDLRDECPQIGECISNGVDALATADRGAAGDQRRPARAFGRVGNVPPEYAEALMPQRRPTGPEMAEMNLV